MEQRAPTAGFQEAAAVEPLLPPALLLLPVLWNRRTSTRWTCRPSPRASLRNAIQRRLRRAPGTAHRSPRSWAWSRGPWTAGAPGLIRAGKVGLPHDFVPLFSPRLTSERQSAAIGLELPRAPLGRNALDVPPRTMAAAPKAEVEPCGFSWILVSNLAPVLDYRTREGPCGMPPGAVCQAAPSGVPRYAAAGREPGPFRLGKCFKFHGSQHRLPGPGPARTRNQTNPIVRPSGYGENAGRSLISRFPGNQAPSAFSSAELEFDIAISAVVPILSLAKTAEAQTVRIPEPPMYPLEPVTMRQAPLKPRTTVDQLNLLQVPEPGSRPWDLKGVDLSRHPDATWLGARDAAGRSGGGGCSARGSPWRGPWPALT